MNQPRTLTPAEREEWIRYLIWDFALAGIALTREQAAEAIDRAFSEPLLELAPD